MPERGRFPIILAHGIARFDILREIFVEIFQLDDSKLDDQLHYFKGIKSHLEFHGFEVHHTSVDFAGGVAKRASQLSQQIKQIIRVSGASKVHIIAHSMGGLDARRMIVDIEGMDEVIDSLTTIGTPHLGTSVADFALSRGGRLIIDGFRSVINLDGFIDLTTDVCMNFNERAKHNEINNNVRYQTYACSERRELVILPLQLAWDIVHQREGDNDGLVSVKSQLWQQELTENDGNRKNIQQRLFAVPADHLNEVGWWDPQETNPFSGALNAKKQAKEYEQKIKEIYLQIAHDL
jgi:triacylglycerol lipase